MTVKSVLTPWDHEEYLIRLYFGSGSDYLERCIDRAYLDLSRTLSGLRGLTQKAALRERSRDSMNQLFSGLQHGRVSIKNQEQFDEFHRVACQDLSTLSAYYGYRQFSVGQAQKWLNMTFKYIFTMGERRVPGFNALYPLCHIPLDRIVIACLRRYGAPKLRCAWSRLNDYDEYLAYQRWIRQRFTLAPLDVEFVVWLGKPIDSRYIADEEVV